MAHMRVSPNGSGSSTPATRVKKVFVALGNFGADMATFFLDDPAITVNSLITGTVCLPNYRDIDELEFDSPTVTFAVNSPGVATIQIHNHVAGPLHGDYYVSYVLDNGY